jgi:hypothetical protein
VRSCRYRFGSIGQLTWGRSERLEIVEVTWGVLGDGGAERREEMYFVSEGGMMGILVWF